VQQKVTLFMGDESILFQNRGLKKFGAFWFSELEDACADTIKDGSHMVSSNFY
jgi:hypothetical protein